MGSSKKTETSELIAKKLPPATEHAEIIVKALAKPDVRLKLGDLAVRAKLTKTQVIDALPKARELRPDLTFGKFDRKYWLANTPTWYSNQTDLSKIAPLAGEIGTISDSHLCSVAERLDVLEEAYDVFYKRGINVVLHQGDMSDGWKEYKGHINFVKCHGDQEQAAYVIEKYPRRDGIKTYLIGGNHDDSYKHTKIDRMSLVVKGFHHQGRDYKGRDDIKYVGQYSHYYILPQEVRIHSLHPRGGNAYAHSYKQQKRAEAMPKNERPDCQLSGHFHVYNGCWHDGTEMLALPGMQDETEFFKRLGLSRSVGYAWIQYKINKGRFEEFAPFKKMFT